MSDSNAAYQSVALAARASYARLLAWLAYQWRDVAAAEDALGSALEKALALWPMQGIPSSPEGWLISVAKRELLQVARHKRLHESPEVQFLLESSDASSKEDVLPDERLKLLFICAHPAIDASVRPALMLQTVLGLDASEVAKAMLTSPAAMAQRLVRAKQKIRDAALRFEEPDSEQLPERLHAVLEAVYAAYGLGWDAVDAGADAYDGTSSGAVSGMREEALYLGSLLCQLLPEEPEAWGLLALMQFCESRVAARYSDAGAFVPLLEQNITQWDRARVEYAEQCLRRASTFKDIGPFQLEAAIQSAYCQRLFTGETPWHAIAALYQRLTELAPSLGARVAYAVAIAQTGDVQQGYIDLLDLDHPRLQSYQPYWVALAHVARLLGKYELAIDATTRAIGLTSALALRAHLLQRLELDRLNSNQ